MIVNVAYAGDGFPWHFDTNNFTITLAIQSADEGGLFEYTPNIRQDGENFEAVKAVLDGVSNRVKKLYDRVLPIHLERAGLRGNSYLD